MMASATLNAAQTSPDDQGYQRTWLMLDPFVVGDSAGEHSEDAQKLFFERESLAGHFTARHKAGDQATITMTR